MVLSLIPAQASLCLNALLSLMVFSRYSSFFPLTKKLYIKIMVDSELTVDVCVSVLDLSMVSLG